MIKRTVKYGPVISCFAYFMMTKQMRQDCKGFYISTINCSRTIPVSIDYMYNLRGLKYPSDEYTQTRSTIHKRVANRILWLCKKNGGIYLKSGQYIGSLESMLPKEYTDTLKVLQDKAPSMPLDKIKVVIENDFNKTLEDVFSSFDETPIAAASLAQVHRGVLKHNNKEVAVKIQFPTLRVQTYYDMIVMSFCLKVVAKLTAWYQFRGLNWVRFFKNFEEALWDELDFLNEAENGKRTKEYFKDEKRIYIPDYYLDFSGKRLLVMEYINNAFKISQADEIKQKYSEKEVVGIAKTMIDVFSKMIFLTGHIHADAHPGNILIREHPEYNGEKPQVVIIDHGLYCKLTDEFISQFRELWFAMCTFDNVKTKEIAYKMGLGEHYRYLPLLFMYRTINSTKPLGGKFSQEEVTFIKDNDEMNLEKMGMLTEKLPANMCFIFKTAQYILIHNK